MVRRKATYFAAGLAATLAALPAVGAIAKDLVLGSRGEATQLDPHFHAVGPNEEVAANLFDPFVGTDDKQQLRPALAESWKALDDTTWEFKLRRGVKWHDGSPFTAEDVLFTADRARDVPNSPAGYDVYLKGKAFSKKDDYTIVVKTSEPYPLTANDMSRIYVVSKKHGQGATTQDYSDGKAAVGTGAFKLVEWVRGDRLVLAANPDYWGRQPRWDRFVIKPIKSDPTRVTAIRSGDVDIIDQVPTPDIATLRKNPALTLREHGSSQIIYFWLDVSPDLSPRVLTNDGQPYSPNPLRDWRVRKALSMAIDRKAIIDRVMEGSGIAAAQMVPEGFFGYSPNVKVETYDPEGAKKLLQEAGYGEGFRLTVSGPADNYPNDRKIVETTAQMLARIGIKAEAEPLPRAVYFSRANKFEFSMGLSGNTAWSGEVSTPLRGLFHTRVMAAGWGPYNRSRYSNPRLDDVIEKALVITDDASREKLLIEANDIASNDLSVLPILNSVYTWALRKGLDYKGRADTHVIAGEILESK